MPLFTPSSLKLLNQPPTTLMSLSSHYSRRSQYRIAVKVGGEKKCDRDNSKDQEGHNDSNVGKETDDQSVVNVGNVTIFM